MWSWFIIKTLKISWAWKKDSIIKLEDSVNIILGPSNVWKSYIFECIKYMLGSKEKPKKIKEAEWYNEIWLEIKTDDGIFYSLMSDLEWWDYRIYETQLDLITNRSIYKTRTRAPWKNSISSFYLNLLNLENKKIRKNDSWKTVDLTYRHIRDIALIDEVSIFKKISPILTWSYTEKTQELSVFRFLLTDIDDSWIIASPTKEEIANKKWRLEFLKELIDNYEKELYERRKNIFQTDFTQIEILTREIEWKLNNLNSEITNINTEISFKKERIYIIKKDLNNLQEVLSRSYLLEEQYKTDLERLGSTIEVSRQLHDGNLISTSICPICKSEIGSLNDWDDVENFILAIETEVEKISFLQKELISARILIEERKDALGKELEKEINNHDNKVVELNKILKTNLEYYNNQLVELYNKKSLQTEITYMENKISDLIIQKNWIEDSKINKTNYNNIIPVWITEKLCELIKNWLTECKYPGWSSVSFSESENDIVIWWQIRYLSGKWFRAITHSIFIICLVIYLNIKGRAIWVLLIDSPLVTYKEPTPTDSDKIPEDMALWFYKYVAALNIWQLILIENKEPPKEIVDKVNIIRFTWDQSNWRYGFIA